MPKFALHDVVRWKSMIYTVRDVTFSGLEFHYRVQGPKWDMYEWVSEKDLETAQNSPTGRAI